MGTPHPTPIPPPNHPHADRLALRRTWRSWNQYGWYITEEIILNAAKGLVDTSRAIKGKPVGTSLKDLGFDGVGMDEGWAACMPRPGPFPHGRDPYVDPGTSALPRRCREHAPVPCDPFPRRFVLVLGFEVLFV